MAKVRYPSAPPALRPKAAALETQDQASTREIPTEAAGRLRRPSAQVRNAMNSGFEAIESFQTCYCLGG